MFIILVAMSGVVVLFCSYLTYHRVGIIHDHLNKIITAVLRKITRRNGYQNMITFDDDIAKCLQLGASESMHILHSLDEDEEIDVGTTENFKLNNANELLPGFLGQNGDLTYISYSTLQNLLSGNYAPMIAAYQVIDCRYPFEFEGGHIRGAVNLYKKRFVKELFREVIKVKRKYDPSEGREVIIFHCEFSSKRGPRLARFWHTMEHQYISRQYKKINFPEVYVLYGGYKEFYEHCKEFCEPNEYRPMLHRGFRNELEAHLGRPVNDSAPHDRSNSLSDSNKNVL